MTSPSVEQREKGQGGMEEAVRSTIREGLSLNTKLMGRNINEKRGRREVLHGEKVTGFKGKYASRFLFNTLPTV